jgi:hypothetical protein
MLPILDQKAVFHGQDQIFKGFSWDCNLLSCPVYKPHSGRLNYSKTNFNLLDSYSKGFIVFITQNSKGQTQVCYLK